MTALLRARALAALFASIGCDDDPEPPATSWPADPEAPPERIGVELALTGTLLRRLDEPSAP